MYVVSLLNSRNFFPLAIDGTPTEYSRFMRNKKNCPNIKLDISDRQKPVFIRITPFNILVTRIDSKISSPATISRYSKNKKSVFCYVLDWFRDTKSTVVTSFELLSSNSYPRIFRLREIPLSYSCLYLSSLRTRILFQQSHKMAIFRLAVVLQTPNNTAHRNWHIAGIFECYQPSFYLQLPANCLALKQSRFYDYIPVDLHRSGRLLRSNKRSTASRKRGQTSNINETSFTFDFTEIRLFKETILIHLFDLFVHRGRSFANSPHWLLYNSVRSSEKYASEVLFDCTFLSWTCEVDDTAPSGVIFPSLQSIALCKFRRLFQWMTMEM